MKLFVEDVAMEFAKTLITSDQREMIELADKLRVKTVKAVATVSFDFADAFVAEAKRRNK